jgi:hypothetical protein
MNAGTTGSAGPNSGVWENGIAPRSSTSGTIEIRNTIKYFFNITNPLSNQVIFYTSFLLCHPVCAALLTISPPPSDTLSGR